MRVKGCVGAHTRVPTKLVRVEVCALAAVRACMTVIAWGQNRNDELCGQMRA